jgi:ubiquinone/menaquinone biosynthesis C-methylase UbiE
MYLKPNYKQDLFKSTANFYAQYRFPYLESMIDSLLEKTGIENNDKLIDLACGPGRLAIPLAKYFSDVLAIDLEEEMIFAGKEIARDLNIRNIQWMVGRAEEFVVSPETIKLITIGDAFHRLDQLTVLQNIYGALKRGGYLAIIGGSIITNGNRDWQKVLKTVLVKWYSPVNDNINYKEQFPNALNEFGFKDVFSCSFEEECSLTVEGIIGYLYSMFIFSKRAIGNDNEEFEKTITNSLLELEPQNIFKYDFNCGYTIGKKE